MVLTWFPAGGPLTAAAHSAFQFAPLLMAAVARELADSGHEEYDLEDIALLPAEPHAPPEGSMDPGPAGDPYRTDVQGGDASAAGVLSSREMPPHRVELQRRKAQSREKRSRRRAESASPYSAAQRPRLPLLKKHIIAAHPIETPLTSQNLPHTNGAYTGGREGRAARHHFRLEDLVGAGSPFGFELVPWDGRPSTVRPITDGVGRVIAVLCGAPNDPEWPDVHAGAAAAVAAARERLSLTAKDRAHRRGDFAALAMGISYGGGQKHTHIKRMAAFGSSVFRTWAPRLYDYYAAHMQPLLAQDPRLRPNFAHSVFACTTFNFGPRTCTLDHRDCGNLPFGWCAISALGDFDPQKGGHLVLWDLKLVIEFPPGSTVMIPSATLRHSNTQVQENEERFSITQYTAGGIFRWVDQGLQPSAAYYSSLDNIEREEARRRAAARWMEGMALFSTLDELQTQGV
ncbi:uncharacterized protein B0H18DRAFT_955931 [Fomitopsis serialis]|uniref:uncharacterized protein n=1 Tax=Fomitopsis serialis TaxID=139415 RepID=UPI0020080A26|nr:uncharacterized protein B0H18DRAFT_955931 [Neoantrodia serialis]KAH9923230.1 hypothetical protein B0H18DRAFT_955931 [Neoantrodia serialis]